MKRFTRRDFMKTTGAGLGALALGASPAGAAELGDLDGPMPTRPLGDTGVDVAILCVGGHHLGRIDDDQEAIRFVRHAIDHGATFMDNAWEYHGGRSERVMGRALRDGYRDRAFLMTKHHGRTDKATAMKHLEDSLRRLQTDVIDLWQYHEIVYPDDPDMIFSPGGAIEAAHEAREQGKVRFIGFTGHKDPAIFQDMLDRDFAWDTVQMPINPLDAHYLSFERRILPQLEKRGIGCLAMKTMGGGFVLQSGVVEPRECLRYAWTKPVATVVSGMTSMDILNENIRLAKGFKPLEPAEERELLAHTEEVAQGGRYEPFKTTRMFDGAVGRRIHDIPTEG
jgi:predicted aldo/keto reductase-like oxidoreductase